MAGDQRKFQIAMARAEEFSVESNWAEAIRAYRFALAEFPNNEAAIIGFGKVSMNSGQIDFAKKAFHQALRINPTNQDALIYIGDIQEKAGQIEPAAETYLRVGNMCAGKMDMDTAFEYWSRAITLVPDKTEAYRKLAGGLAQHGQPRLAARQYLALAAVYQEQDALDQAMHYIHEAEQLIPRDPGINAAKEALQAGTPIDPDEISETTPASQIPFPAYVDERSAKYALDEDPFAIEEPEVETGPTKGLVGAAQDLALTELANLVFEEDCTPQTTTFIIQAIDLQSNGNLSEAAKNYHQVVQSGMRRPALYFNLGLLWKDLGQLNQAAEMLNLAAQDDQYHLSAQFSLGEIYHSAGKLDAALRRFVDVVKNVDLQSATGQQQEDLANRYAGLANNYLGQSDTGKINTFISALKKFFGHPSWEKKAVEARQLIDSVAENGTMSLAEYLETPETEVVITAMAFTNMYMKRNLLMTASEECLRAIQKAPSYLPLHVRLADILIKQGQTDQSIAKYLYIAKVYQMRGTPELSIDVYHKILRLAPMDVNVRSALIDIYISQKIFKNALDQYLVLADSYYQLAQVDRALEKYNEALRLATNTQNTGRWKMEILTRMGDIYNQRFDWAGAAAAYEELNKAKPGDEQIQRRLIDFYFKQNKSREAIAALDKLLSHYQRQAPLKAVEMLKELTTHRPEDMYLRQRMAIAYAQNGMTKQAIAEYDALGEMQLESGLRDQAVQTIQAIINLGPEDVDGYRRLLAQLGGGSVG